MPDLVKRDQISVPEQAYALQPTRWSVEPGVAGWDLRRYYQIIRKRKWVLLAVVFTVMAGVTVETLSTTPLYRAVARVQILPETPKVLPYESVNPTTTFYDDFYLQTKYQTMQTRTLARRVIKRLDLPSNTAFNFTPSPGFLSQQLPSLTGLVTKTFYWIRPDREALPPKPLRDPHDLAEDAGLVDRFLGSLDVQIMKNSWLIEIIYVSHDPQLASRVVNALTEEVIEESFEKNYEATMKATDFLQRQLRDLKIKVEKSEQDLVNYGRAHNILNLSERQNIVTQNLSDLNQEMTRVQTQLISQTARYNAIKNASVENFPPSLKNNIIASLETRHSALEQSLVMLTVRFGPQWPEVVQVKREIAEVKNQLSKEREQAINQSEMEFQVALDHSRRLSSALDDQKRLANQLREESIQYNILQREVDTNEQLYEGLLQRLKQAGVSAGLRSSDMQIVDAAEVPRSPYRPRTDLNLAMGLFFALIPGIGLVFLLESLDNTIKTPEQSDEFLGLASLGVIPSVGRFLERGDRRLLADRRGHLKAAPILLYRFLESRSQIWEAYRSLRTSILLSHSDRRPQKMLITSALVGEGKTTTAVNTAIVMAQTGARTLVMDLDMRRPSLAHIFGTDSTQGMSNFLSGNSDLGSQIRNTAFSNLYFLPAGPTPPNPAELIGSTRMKNALALLERYFDHIIIDSPPILSVTDPLVLSPYVDGVILVIQSGTPRDAARKASANLLAVGATILGTVLNNVNIHSSDYSYYYRYHYQYDYYHRGKDNAA